MVIEAFLGIDDPALIAAVVSLAVTGVAAIIRYFVDRGLLRSKAEIDYEYEQRKELRAAIGSYHGRLLEAAIAMHMRLVNLNDPGHTEWLELNGDFSAPWPERYYFKSTVYRFLAFAALANKFERDAIFIDSRIGRPEDQLFLFYIKAFRWTLTGAALFDGLSYDDFHATDHFFTDHLRRMCATVTDNGGVVDQHGLEDLLGGAHKLTPVLEFFDGLKPVEWDGTTKPLAPGALRWDRLMALHIVLMAFINTFGYEVDESEPKWFDAVAGRMKAEVAANLLSWLPKLGVGSSQRTLRRDLDPGGALAVAALRKRALAASPEHRNRLMVQAELPADVDPQV